MKKIYYLEKHPVKIGDVIEHNGYKAIVTEKLIKFNPELFVVENPMKELLDKAKKDYPIGTMFNSKHGMQEVLSDEPFIGIGMCIPGTIQISTNKFHRGATIYTPEDGWAEILPLKFTTEDGVDIYGDMKTYAICREELILELPSVYGGNSPTLIYFYHKENALDYIEKHRVKTLKDYESILHANKKLLDYSSYYDGAAYNVSVGVFFRLLKANEPKLYYTKILQLIADDLNDGRYIHERSQPSFHINKERRVTLHMGDDEGCVYFKSGDLAEKARDILGNKLEYLYN